MSERSSASSGPTASAESFGGELGSDSAREPIVAPDTDAPRGPELEFEFESAGDPMASIRPPLPSSPPLRAQTVELSDYESSPTNTRMHMPEAGRAAPTLALDDQRTHETGSFVFVREVDDEGDEDESAYVLRELIGEGGMGEVWRAGQRSLGRQVALKRLRRGSGAPSSIIKQFESEARLTGALDHPNIVTVHELGRDQRGRVFYTMKEIVGTPWSALISEGVRVDREGNRVTLELRDHLEILLEVANAIAFAHSRGILHRDIKPGNVMVGDYGEVQVVDWGLAVAVRRLLDDAETWTIATLPDNALTCGTPAYMAPETALAERSQICAGTDVYLLGAVLYHVLYGRPPHRGRTVPEVIDAAKRNAWSLPERVPTKLRPWHALLRPILTRALASDPGARHVDAGAFAEALHIALRNYDSAKLASGAADQLAGLDLASCSAFVGYQELAKIVARFEEALHDWPGNVVARRGLAQAHLRLAEFALGHRDIGFAEVHLAAFEGMPGLPEPSLDSVGMREDSRMFPLADHTMVGAPQPADTMVASALPSQPESLEAVGAARREPSAALVGAMFGAPPELLARLASTDPQGTRARSSGSLRRQTATGPLPVAELGASASRFTLGPNAAASLAASVTLGHFEHEELLEVEREHWTWAIALRTELRMLALAAEQRRRSVKALWGLAIALGVGLAIVLVFAAAYMVHERDRTEAERNRLVTELLDEAAATTEAQIDGIFGPVHAVLIASADWARQGLLDSDEPEQLNRLFMPVLEGVPVSTSMLRADAIGHEYMLLRTASGWQTRTTVPGQIPRLRQWNRVRKQTGVGEGRPDYDPHTRPWYVGGAALRSSVDAALRSGETPPVHWTPPYRFFTTQEPGISVSTPATSPSGRAFVIAFDIKLADISRFTEELPRGISQGQVFVIDEHDQLLGLPRETIGVAERNTLVLREMGTLADALPLSHAAWQAWRERERTSEPFRIGEAGEAYWVDFRVIDRPERPRLWIGVVLPESHFVD